MKNSLQGMHTLVWMVCPVKTQGLFSKSMPSGEPSAEVSRTSCIVSVGLTFEVFSNHHHCAPPWMELEWEK